jgi:hypothetical protein
MRGQKRKRPPAGRVSRQTVRFACANRDVLIMYVGRSAKIATGQSPVTAPYVLSADQALVATARRGSRPAGGPHSISAFRIPHSAFLLSVSSVPPW